MNLTRDFFVRASVLMVLAELAVPDPFISGYALQDYGFTGRSLLQTPKDCPIRFEFMNYTIITSKCMGPQYKADTCCSSFKEFACPYAEQLNDLKNNCASVMLTYINQNGNYPPGLFSSECREGKEGLDCAAYVKTNNSTASSSSDNINGSLFPLAWYPLIIRGVADRKPLAFGKYIIFTLYISSFSGPIFKLIILLKPFGECLYVYALSWYCFTSGAPRICILVFQLFL